MEKELKSLLETHQEENRNRIAREWKQQGKKVIGYMCSYVPEEVISAAGMLPWRILGSSQVSTARASLYQGENACLFCQRALAGLMEGQWDFLDGVVTTNSCDDMQRTWEIWRHVAPERVGCILHLPRGDDEIAIGAYARSMEKLIQTLEGNFPAVKISPESLRQAIGVHNQTRRLLREISELRKQEKPPLSGSEALALSLAAQVMPKAEFNQRLEALMPYLEKRQVFPRPHSPRLLVASSLLATPAFLELVEQAGAQVVMEDICTGSRYFWSSVDATLEPTQALARRYLGKPPCPRMFFYSKGLDQVVAWVAEYQIDGVLHLPQLYCRPWEHLAPVYVARLQEHGIPVTSVTREYDLTNVGQLRTRIEAFVEMLAARKGVPQSAG